MFLSPLMRELKFWLCDGIVVVCLAECHGLSGDIVTYSMGKTLLNQHLYVCVTQVYTIDSNDTGPNTLIFLSELSRAENWLNLIFSDNISDVHIDCRC